MRPSLANSVQNVTLVGPVSDDAKRKKKERRESQGTRHGFARGRECYLRFVRPLCLTITFVFVPTLSSLFVNARVTLAKRTITLHRVQVDVDDAVRIRGCIRIYTSDVS